MTAFNEDSRLAADFINDVFEKAVKAGDVVRFNAAVKMRNGLNFRSLAVVPVDLVERLTAVLNERCNPPPMLPNTYPSWRRQWLKRARAIVADVQAAGFGGKP